MSAYNQYTEKDAKKPTDHFSQVIQEWGRTHGVEASLNRVQELSTRSGRGGVVTFDVGDLPLEALFQDVDFSDEKSLLDKLSKVSTVLQQHEEQVGR